MEQSTANIMYFSLAEQLYPESGYYAETGGYLANLRNSTNIKKVREYHKKFYRWEAVSSLTLNYIWKVSLLDPLLCLTRCLIPDWFLFMSSHRHKAPWSLDTMCIVQYSDSEVFILLAILRCLVCTAYRAMIVITVHPAYHVLTTDLQSKYF